jgi:hypothetical protein
MDRHDERFDGIEGELRGIRSELKSLCGQLDDLREKVDDMVGYRKESGHALKRSPPSRSTSASTRRSPVN